MVQPLPENSQKAPRDADGSAIMHPLRMVTTSPVTLRPATAEDTDAIVRLNALEVPLVSAMDAERLSLLTHWADRLTVAEVDGRFAGFVMTFGPGTPYDSPNYRWFCDRFGDAFYYLDRVAVDPSMRRRGVAGAIYDEVESVGATYGRLALEVNVDPPNEPSLAFHTRRGYVEVGRLGEPGHQVTMLELRLEDPR
jgi:predicted GNAT superfamily acetyltransferase